MKNTLCIATICAALLAIPTAFGGTIISVVPVQPIVSNGETFNVDVVISGLPDLIGFQFDLAFPNFLSLNSVTEAGYFAANGVSFSAGTPSADTVTGIFDVLVSPGVPDPDTLVRFSFTAFGLGTGNISLDNILLLNSSFEEVPVDENQFAEIAVIPGPPPTGTEVPEPGGFSLTMVAAGVALAAYWRFGGFLNHPNQCGRQS